MPRAIVPAKGSIDVKVKYTDAQLGQMSLPMYVRIVGLEENAFTVELNANAIRAKPPTLGPCDPVAEGHCSAKGGCGRKGRDAADFHQD